MGDVGRGAAWVGCSGWVYRDWRGIVYPERLPQRRWFEHCTTLFDTVEINNTFYRLPPPSTTERWAAQAPPGFTYAHDLLADHPWELTTDWTYVRFHGPQALEAKYHGLYGGRRLWRVADRLESRRDRGVDVYAYFNNDWHGHAVTDARWLASRLAGRAAPTP